MFGSTKLKRPFVRGVRRQAFTLLEVILAMTLTATLMLLVWSLFRTYTKLEERSSRAAVELQLVRAVSRQLRSDLEHFALLPTPVELPNSSSRRVETPPVEPSENGEQNPADAPQDNTPASVVEPEAEASTSSRTVEAIETRPGSFDAVTSPASIDQPTIGEGIEVRTDFSRNDLYRNTFDASLPSLTYLKGSKNRLEFVTRLPYTIDVPVGQQRLSGETRYGTHQLVLYQFNDSKKLEALLQEDPILNPSRWRPPPQTDPNAPKPVAQRLDPNRDIGLIREMKSWLHVTRDRQREELKKQAEAAGLLVNGELPSADPRFVNRFQQPDRTATLGTGEAGAANSLYQWQPPPEFRHKRDHIPEVTKLQFRYLDNETWTLDWNREQLPRAVEVAFDLDPKAPADRAKEFELAHASMLGGQSLQQVLPPPDLEEETDLLSGLDSLNTLDIEDPTAIVAEYRFVILLPRGIEREDNNLSRELSR